MNNVMEVVFNFKLEEEVFILCRTGGLWKTMYKASTMYFFYFSNLKVFSVI